MSETTGKPVALVTGAAQGIGEGIARMLGAAGFIVVLGDLESSLVNQTASTWESRNGGHGNPPGRDQGRGMGRGLATDREPLGRAGRPGEQRGDQPAGHRRDDRRGALGPDPGREPEGALAGDQGGAAPACAAAGDDRQHRLDAGDPAHARARSLCRQQGGAVGSDPAGRRRVPLEGITCNMVAPGWVDTAERAA